MDPEYVLSWAIGLSSAFEFVGPWVGFPRRAASWRWLAAGLLALVAFVALADVSGGTWVVAGLWATFVGLPTLADKRRADSLHQHRLQRAATWARLAASLHPFGDTRSVALLLSARALSETERRDAAIALLQGLERDPHVGELARLEALRLDARWSALVDRLDHHPVETPEQRCIALEAYGETGDYERLLETLARLYSEGPATPELDLRAAAYTGRVEVVEHLLRRHDSLFAEPIADYYRGIALQVGGDPATARSRLQAAEGHPAYARRALARLRRPLPELDERQLSSRERHGLATVTRELSRELATPPTPQRRPWLTWALGGLIAMVFSIGAPDGTVSTERLLAMGALLVPAESGAEPWRVVTAGFVHAGLTHLLVDLSLLLLLGSPLERLWGRLPLAACFLSASTGSYLIATLISDATVERPELLMGASAGVFGIVGGLIAFDTIGYAIDRAPALKRRLVLMAVFLLAQFVFDALTPFVRASLHLSGVVLGALVATPLALHALWPRRTFA